MNDPTSGLIIPYLRGGAISVAVSTVFSIGLAAGFLALAGCGAGGDEAPMVTTTPTAAGASASLIWDPVQDPTVTGYSVHYGTQSAGQPGLCAYEESKFVTGPSATITGLNPNTRYFFAVSAYNGLEGPCSNEVSTVTPPAQT